MSAKVTYDDNRILPTPFPSISKEIETYDNGEISNVKWTITLTGHLIANMGSPKTTGVYGDFTADDCENIPSEEWTSAITQKWCILSDLFCDFYKEICIGNGGVLHNITAYPRLVSMDLDTSDQNAHYAQYTIVLEADTIYCDGTEVNPRPSGMDCIKNFDETWDFSYDRNNITQDFGDNRVFSISRTLSAVGIPQITTGTVTKTAYNCAKDYVCGKLTYGTGAESEIPDNCMGLPSFIDLNKQRNYSDSHSSNVLGGSYSVTEEWVYSSGDYTEEYNVSHDKSINEACDTVSISGSFNGYDCRQNGSVILSAFEAAKSGFDELSESGLLSRAESIAGIVLDPNSESSSISYNKNTGVVNYDYTFKQRPDRYITVSKYEDITLSNNWDEDVVSTVLILGKGEFVKKNNTVGYKALSTSLDIDLVFPCETEIIYDSGEEPDPTGINSNFSIDDIPPYGPRFNPKIALQIQSVVNVYNPANVTLGGSAVFDNVSVESQNENWNRQSGSYSYSCTWTYNYAGICGT